MVAMTVIAYICPMAVQGSSVRKSDLSNLCQSISPISSDMNGVVGCMSTHMAVAWKFIGDIPSSINFILALVLLASAHNLIIRNFLAILIQPLLSSLRYSYFCYRTSIKFLIEKRLLKYLNNLGDYTITSVV
jgi:hypothetical protein